MSPRVRGRERAEERGIVTRQAIGLGVILAIALLAGCRGASAVAKPAGYIQAELEASPISLDPRFATDAISSRVAELIFDSLVKLDARGNFIGDLAENFQRRSPTEIRFNLRHGIRFSDGRSLTAADVKYTYDSVMDAAIASPKAGRSTTAAPTFSPPWTGACSASAPITWISCCCTGQTAWSSRTRWRTRSMS